VGPAQRLFAGLLFVALAAAGFAGGRTLLRPEQNVSQPIAFNHRLHSEVLDCETCHEGFNDAAHAGLPGLEICMMCHEEPQTDLLEEQKVRDLAAAGEDLVFQKLFTLPDNVFYTHRRHVGIAGLECEACHGSIAETETPPETPLVSVNMDFCVDCHLDQGLSTDCTGCHR
jgi:hypothetical protein